MKMPKFTRLTKNQKRDFKAYVRGMRNILTGSRFEVNTEVNAKSLAHWFFLWDTHGIYANYRNLSLCQRLVQAKGQLNLTIKLWIEDMVHPQGPLFAAQEYKTYCEELPAWVWKSLCEQCKTAAKYHYIPTFARADLLDDLQIDRKAPLPTTRESNLPKQSLLIKNGISKRNLSYLYRPRRASSHP